MKKTIVFWLAIALSPLSWATDIRGQIQVMSRDAKQLLASHEHAIIYLSNITSKTPKESVSFRQKNKQFQPRLLPVVIGQTVNFKNDDRVQHNVFSSDKRKQFDLGRYPNGDSKSVIYDQEGNYKVYCNIHRKMIADIVVVPSIYYAITDENGHYVIKNVPKGKYDLKAWHIYGGSEQKKIEIKNEEVTLDMTLVSTKLIRDLEKHKNKNGNAYKKKSKQDPNRNFDDQYDDTTDMDYFQ